MPSKLQSGQTLLLWCWEKWMETTELYFGADFFTVSVCSTSALYPHNRHHSIHSFQSISGPALRPCHLILGPGIIRVGLTVPTGFVRVEE